MLRTLTAALLATTLVAGTAFAADPGAAGSAPTPAAPAATTNAKASEAAKPAQPVTKSTKTVKHVRKGTHKGTHKHLSRVKTGKMHQARHVKHGTKTHQASGAASAKRS